MTETSVFFGVLGPVEVRVDSATVALPSRVRVLLAALLCRPNRTVSVDELTDIVWSNEPPAAPATLRSHVLRLRRLLGEGSDRVVTTGPGYRIEVGPRTELDSLVFGEHCESARDAARSSDWPAVWTAASAALGLWRGAPLADVNCDRLHRDETPGWAQSRVEVTELAARAGLELGRAAESVLLLTRLAAEEPHQEGVHALLIEALAIAGRRAEALAVYRRLRTALARDLGIEPGARIAAAHQRVLRSGGNSVAGHGGSEPAAVASRERPVAPGTGSGTGPAAVAVAIAGAGALPGGPGTTACESGAAVCESGVAVCESSPALPGARRAPAEPVTVLRQLPADLPFFNGRTEELRTLLAAPAPAAGPAAGPAGVSATVLVTAIEGMAGVGKTRLAVHAAHELVRAGRFSTLQLYVNLRGFDPDRPPADPSDVLAGLLHALGVDRSLMPEGLDARAALFRDRLHGREALLLLDDAADAHQVRPLIPADPGCLVLVTSRRSLAGLDGARSLPLATLAPAEALQLLAAVAGAERVADSPAAAAQVIHACGNLPLALVLAAARLRARPAWRLADLVEYLRPGGISALTTGGRSLRASFDLSYRGLPEEARRVFRLLAVHPGREYTAPAIATLAGVDPATARETLELLVDEHLLIQDTPARYRLHDLLHAFAAELTEGGAADRLALYRLTVWYCHTARAADELLRTRSSVVRPRYAPPLPPPVLPALRFPDHDRTLAWLDVERANLTAVLSRAAEHGLGPLVAALALSLSWYLHTRGPASSLLSVLRTTQATVNPEADPELAARVLTELGDYHALTRRYQDAVRHHERALELHRANRDREGEAATLLSLGSAHDRLNRPQEAVRCWRQARVIFAELGNRLGAATCLVNLARSYRALERFDEAVSHDRDALAAFRGLDDEHGQAQALAGLGELHQLLDRDTEAVDYRRQALLLYRRSGDRYAEAEVLNGLGTSYSRLGRPEQAVRAWRGAHSILTDIAHPRAAEIERHLAGAAGPAENRPERRSYARSR
ncbi:AfsR/SARP family transcriptional regulator [Kitasatospora purpeofusca]|uniref:AfsR/SARP family transcriptional regulator n=1 Tax=Kitasatospora purpeofusca TaxID=67352 RepID=UPI002A5A46A0|nr:BTAD domain-containing putative transcriptional regulator [Kitasatospora purpeofusca]MDY0812686.1 BTAD domain-containing putative transcriptional regulator [Kitasatospora purpeofusca]